MVHSTYVYARYYITRRNVVQSKNTPTTDLLYHNNNMQVSTYRHTFFVVCTAMLRRYFKCIHIAHKKISNAITRFVVGGRACAFSSTCCLRGQQCGIRCPNIINCRAISVWHLGPRVVVYAHVTLHMIKFARINNYKYWR